MSIMLLCKNNKMVTTLTLGLRRTYIELEDENGALKQ
jgi:hypothetical protein